MVKALMHLTCKGRLREVGLLSLNKRRLMVGISSVCAKWGVEETNSSQCCPLKGREVKGTK